MVPAMYNLCLLQADFDDYDLSSWRIGGYGGAPMPIATIEKLAAKIPGLKLVNAYGSTETTSPSTIMPPELTAAHLDSVGLPCPGARYHRDGRETAASFRAAKSARSGFAAVRSSRATGTTRRQRPKALPPATGTPAISVRSTLMISCACSIARRT